MFVFMDDLVEKYINGDDLPVSTELLEDNYDFMINVINRTNDKKMIHYCSNNLMNNYDFIKYLINKFKDDTVFVEKTALNYLKNQTDEDIIFEFNIIIAKYTKDDDLKTKCGLRSIAKYNELLMILEYENKEGNLSIENFGMGYFYLSALYDYSEEVKEYCAKMLLDEIFFNTEKLSLENTIHKVYKTPDTILKHGKNNYLLNVIKCKDTSLYEYVSTHLKLLDKIYEELNRIISNWDNYIRCLNDNRFRSLYDEIDNYNRESLTSSTSQDIFDYVIDEAGLTELYKTTDFYNEISDYSEELDDIIANMSDEDYNNYLESKKDDIVDVFINCSKITKEDLKTINYGRVVLRQLFSEDYIVNINDDKYMNNNRKLVIIK